DRRVVLRLAPAGAQSDTDRPASSSPGSPVARRQPGPVDSWRVGAGGGRVLPVLFPSGPPHPSHPRPAVGGAPRARPRRALAEQLRVALSGMSDLDREVLALRHFEELSNNETARVLGLSDQAASIRYVRAITRLRKVLEAIPGFMDVDYEGESR